ncbi:CCT_1a_G0048280.mRNA.1.CDS.1 [Saccharomyces cerevisiae]|nr:CCT_1a_G0031840.mRNA.1.CDS.1 [Saccharomyces cerevisiae]CAI4777654.1 CCT_1a_G0048280.mRNA.1.CDS.1 [Saccharomyces cerevisiae]CAI7376992.1 CCT_1a_G0031840.mRNA.1.CDS.1 [Saccharomyces cerevisiae]CAI7454321.1 CCT_1a_G0048280.mRNA.1.CDS.1 [Saccharomyces cerevisiae]
MELLPLGFDGSSGKKRSTGYIDTIAGLDFHSSSPLNLTAINTTMQTVGLVLFGAFDYMNT